MRLGWKTKNRGKLIQVLAYNLKQVMEILGVAALKEAMQAQYGGLFCHPSVASERQSRLDATK